MMTRERFLIMHEGAKMQQSTQVLVIGGGPGGSTAASLLAREGFDVTLIEKAIFPRYHVGESLLPSCLEILDTIGAREKIEAHGFQRKEGGYFDWGEDSWTLDFTKLRHPYGFQVVRSEFDHLLLEHAKSQGVKVHEGIEVKSITFNGERPRSAIWARVAADEKQGSTEEQEGEIAFDYVIDASGRAGLLTTRYLKGRHYHNAFQNVGIWGYYQGAMRQQGVPEGAISVGAIPEGWVWAIPLHNGTTSVGVVMHKTAFKEHRQAEESVEHIYEKAIADSVLISGLLKDAERISDIKAEQDYSYISETLTGPGYFLIGDAACFIDPLLSTGVHLATHSALLAAASVASLLRGEQSEEDATLFFDQSYRHAYLRLIVLISALYQQYNGVQTYFWQAQQLTNKDYEDSTALNEALLYIISGMEDLKDTEHGAKAHDLEGIANSIPESERASIAQQAYHRVFWRASISPETAIEGLYIVTKPQLGLKRTDSVVVGAV